MGYTVIDNVGEVGIVGDVPAQAVADGAWTDSRNVRYRDGAAEKIKGYSGVFGSLSATAIAAYTISDGTTTFWTYANNTVIYATDGVTHANVSHLSLGYNATDDLGWTGGAFHGQIVLTDGVGIPQSWQPALGNRFTSLTAWPVASLVTKVLRPHLDFIFALRNTTSGSYNPRELRWSDKASQGSLPLSWDYADPTNQAGINELGQTGDLLVDGLTLRSSFIIYKEFHTWIADYVGGLDIFNFRQLYSQSGMLTENCAIDFGDRHLVLTDSDVIVHDGNSQQSILTRRLRRNFIGRINPNRFRRCFVALDVRNTEILVCVPESGYDWPNLALFWNYAQNTVGYRELGGTKTWGAHGTVPSGTSQTFDADSGQFDAATDYFDADSYSPSVLKLLWFDATRPKAYQDGEGETFDGTGMVAYAERLAMGLSMDLVNVHRIMSVTPMITGTAGDTFNIFIGVRDALDAPISFSGPYVFTLGTDYLVDCRLDGRIIDLRVEYSGTNSFRLTGFRIESFPTGQR
jgi:hypothetical protein